MTNRGEGMKTVKGLKFGEGRISKKEGKSLKGIGTKAAHREAQTKFSSSFGLGASLEMSICPPPPPMSYPRVLPLSRANAS